MKRRQGWLFFIIFLLTLSVYLLINYPLQLGLDLQGGSHPLVASRVLGKTALLEFRTQKEGTSTDLKTLQLQRLSIKELIEQYSYAEKNQNDDNFLKVIQDDLKDKEQELNYSSTSNDLYGKLIEIKKYVDKEITNLFIKTDLSGKDLINAGLINYWLSFLMANQ